MVVKTAGDLYLKIKKKVSNWASLLFILVCFGFNSVKINTF